MDSITYTNSIQPNPELLNTVERGIRQGINNTLTTIDTGIPAIGAEVPVFVPRPILGMSVIGFIGVLIGVLLLMGFIYAKIRAKEVEREYAEKIKKSFIRPTLHTVTNKRWEKVRSLFESPNSSDWRLGIIEADAMLDDLTKQLQYPGETLGDRLKSATLRDFPTLNHAWEAHKTRNTIAHEGLNYHLSPEEAWRTFKLFETIFKDAQYI